MYLNNIDTINNYVSIVLKRFIKYDILFLIVLLLNQLPMTIFMNYFKKWLQKIL